LYSSSSQSLVSSNRLNLSNTSLGDGNAHLLFKAWNSTVGEGVDQDHLEDLDDDDETIEEDVFRDDGDAPFSLISLRIANNKIEKFAAKELAKFLRGVGSCLAEVRAALFFLYPLSSRRHLFTLVSVVGYLME
jgi:hypothetical protein